MTPLPRPIWPGGPTRAASNQLRSIEAQELLVRAATNHCPPRTITQLCGSAEGLFALCNDGTVWQLIGGVWAPEPGIPQRQMPEGEL